MCFVKRNSNEKIATNQQPKTITQITKGRKTLSIEFAQNATNLVSGFKYHNFKLHIDSNAQYWIKR